jgi:hypothetical protein
MKTCIALLLSSTLLSAGVTYTKEVAPILFQRCAECHRPGEVAPMSLLTYQQVRPWAKAIKEKVTARLMPPWLADPRYGHFRNERRLTDQEIATVAAWVDAGAPKGSDQDMPPQPAFVAGWQIGKPDVVIALQEEVPVPAEGVIPYKYFRVPTNFSEDKWVEAAEIRASNRSVVHHVIVFVLDPDQAASSAQGEGRGLGTKLSGWAPGEQPRVYPPGTAKLIKAGSVLNFQMHYTPNGKPASDRTYIGLRFAKQLVQKKALTATALNATFRIPPGDPNYEVRSSWTAKEDVRLVDLMPHMHLRGKDFQYTVVYPDGRSEVILSVPKYDFNWQLVYQFRDPVPIPKGGRLECVAHFDNSANNKFNPDASKEVRWGPQTWEEMMIGWFDYILEADRGAAATSGAGAQ